MGVVNLIQFVHPHGEKKDVSVELPDSICELAKQQVLTCEALPPDYSKIAFYSHLKGIDPEEEGEHILIANNGPGRASPKNTLRRLIEDTSKGIQTEINWWENEKSSSE